MTNTQDTADARITLRLPHQLDSAMRETAGFFRRPVSEEWRSAALLYRRALALWADAAATSSEAPSGLDDDRERRWVLSLCADLMPTPPSLEALRNELRVTT